MTCGKTTRQGKKTVGSATVKTFTSKRPTVKRIPTGKDGGTGTKKETLGTPLTDSRTQKGGRGEKLRLFKKNKTTNGPRNKKSGKKKRGSGGALGAPGGMKKKQKDNK